MINAIRYNKGPVLFFGKEVYFRFDSRSPMDAPNVNKAIFLAYRGLVNLGYGFRVKLK